MMLDALKDYLVSQGYTNVFADYMPPFSTQPELIYISCWNHSIAEMNDGTGVYYIQVQVRRTDPAAARQVCTDIFKLLDSGLDEKLIELNADSWCIARPRRGVLLLDRTTEITTYYYELALWGEN